jgi:hypothetical protein
MTMHDDPARLPRVTDAAIAAMFERRSRRGDGAGLRDLILTATTTTAQERRWYPRNRTRFPRPIAYAFIAALLVLAIVALALIAAGAFRHDSAPTPTQTAEWFVRPFEYAIPAGSGLRPVADGPHRDVIGWVEDSDGPPAHSADPLLGGVTPDFGGQRPESGIARGIIVGSGEKAWSHAGDRFFISPTPAAFIADLRDRSGVAMGPIVETSLDGRPALTTVLAGTASNDIHVDGSITGLNFGPFVLVNNPARLTVTEVDGETIFILIWARTTTDLDAWMPVADRFVDSIHFLPQVDPSPPH